MNQRLNIGLAIKILSDAITFSSLNEVDGDQFYESNKKKISRMAELDLSKMTNNDFDILIDFSKRIDRWAEWSKEKGYLTGFQQTAISDFFMILFEATQLNPPLTKEMAEHFFCYALAKVLYFQIQNRRKNNPNETKYEAMYWTLPLFDFFGDDENYKKDFTPIASSFSLLNSWVKDINKVIRYWENQITVNGKRESPLDLKLYISRWQKGVTPSWNIIKLFFDNDLSLPIEYFIDDPYIQKDGYRAFKSNLYMAFLITNLFDSLERNKIISTESRMMIRNGMKLYLKDFFVIRNENVSVDFEKEAKQNLMFRILFSMLDGELWKIPTVKYLQVVYSNPQYPIILD